MNSVMVDIGGRAYPLCMTVAAMDRLCERCGGLENLGQFLSGGGDAAKAMANTVFALGVLAQEGEEHRLMLAECYGGDPQPRRKVPGPEQLRHLFTPAAVPAYQLAVMEAVNASVHQEVEAEAPKNGESAG